MSWRSSGGFKSESSRPTAPQSSGKGDPKLIDPTLQALIIASLVVGLVGFGLMAGFGGILGSGTQAVAQPAPAQPAARPTAPPVPTVASAAAQPTAAPAAAAAAALVTEPIGPALATGAGAALAQGTDPAQLVFSQPELTVKNGVVTLTFTNDATAVQHNFVLVNGDDTVAEAVNNAAQSQVTRQTGAAGSVPPADSAGLLFATQMLNPGEAATVNFQTPGPGTYTFLCTFPGHYIAGMNGKLTVTQ